MSIAKKKKKKRTFEKTSSLMYSVRKFLKSEFLCLTIGRSGTQVVKIQFCRLEAGEHY